VLHPSLFNNTINKHTKKDSGGKTAFKKASEHGDVDMFEPALEFGTHFTEDCSSKTY